MVVSHRRVLEGLLSVGLLGLVSAEADPAHPHPTSAYPVPVVAHEAPYCANHGVCVPPALCAPWYLESLYDPAAPCYLGPNTPGVCCVNKKHPHPCESFNQLY